MSVDNLDKQVYTETYQIRDLYYEACARLGLKPRELTPVVIGMRSVREEDGRDQSI